MKAPQRIVTARLVLRRWRDDDVEAMTGLNGDRHVMRFFPSTVSPPEAAGAALRDVFERLVPEEMIAYAAALNGPSRRVMAKLGMLEDREAAFDHPALAQGDRLRRHVVYRIARADFLARTDRR